MKKLLAVLVMLSTPAWAFTVTLAPRFCPSGGEDIGVTCYVDTLYPTAFITDFGCEYDPQYYGLPYGPRIHHGEPKPGVHAGLLECNAIEGKLVGCYQAVEGVFTPPSNIPAVQIHQWCTIEDDPGYIP